MYISVSPRFLVTPSNPTETVEGVSLLIQCKADGDPVPTISWDRLDIICGYLVSCF